MRRTTRRPRRFRAWPWSRGPHQSARHRLPAAKDWQPERHDWHNITDRPCYCALLLTANMVLPPPQPPDLLGKSSRLLPPRAARDDRERTDVPAWPCRPYEAGICADVMARFRLRILLSRRIGVRGGPDNSSTTKGRYGLVGKSARLRTVRSDTGWSAIGNGLGSTATYQAIWCGLCHETPHRGGWWTAQLLLARHRRHTGRTGRLGWSQTSLAPGVQAQPSDYSRRRFSASLPRGAALSGFVIRY
jgi:hypothetical protein